MSPFRRMSLALCVPLLCSSFLLMDCQEVSTFTMQYQILEEVQPGTVLGRLSEEIGWTGGSWGTFQLLQPSAVFPIQMDSRDGLLSTAGRLDREQLCHHRDPCVLSFSVLAAQYFTLIHVEVRVLDINDNGPRFPQAALELEISESVSLQTRIPLGRALDLDAGSNAFCSYFLSPSEHFALEVIAGSDGTRQPELVVIQEVDRELHSSFELLLTAVDHGAPPRSGTTIVSVNVLDSNDNSPVFAQGSVSVDIREDALAGTLLINLTATDPDQGPNGEIEYSFSKHVSEEVLSTFAVEGHTGSVLLLQSLDYEKNSAYELEVQARDRGANSVPAHCKLSIRVLDVNDNPPEIQVVWAKQAAVLSEAQPQGSFVALVRAFDPDLGRNGQVDCYIRQGEEHFALKRFSPGSYMLLTNAPLDRESWPQHHLTLLAQDRGTPSLATTRHLTVHVSDVNDNMPCFETDHYHVSIAENSEPPSALVMVRAQDADSGLNGKVVYRIPDPLVLEWLTIDASTGEIRAYAAFDAEKITSLDFLVIAEDMGQPQLSANVSVMVAVLDVNDNSPVVIKPELEGGLASVTVLVDPDTGHVLMPKEEGNSELAASANAPLLLTILATDADSGLNGILLYSILSGNEAGICVLDSQSGQLYLNGSNASSLVDREWDLLISVSDRGSVPLSTRFLVKITFKRHCERMPDSFPVSQPLSPSVVMGICLLGLLAISLVGLGLIMSLCKREKHGGTAYNCREAEEAYSQQQPKKPPKPIQKADIHVVPVLRQEDAQQPQAEMENPSEAAWLKALGVPCHMTPTLYRTLRNQRNSSSLSEQAPFCAQRFRSPTARDMQPTDKKLLDSIFWPKDHLSERAKTDPEEAPSRQHILRSLVRLSLAALAEQGPGGQLAMESAPVQQISQLLSLLHQGQVQPKPNHRGNKYSAKNACCRNPNSNVEDLITKEDSGCEHHDWQLLGKELGNLLYCKSGLDLDERNVEDPAWMARLSFPISTDYKDNVVSPGAVQSPLSEEATGRNEPRTFATFGKAGGHKPNSAEARLSSAFLSEMNTLFEKILAQKVSPQVDS